uniref:Uncharacterized protein n=1 Tax=Glossina palpalis gambiensis TaxID=67801 RepID=A0A1B0BWQ6_9MUSC
MKLAVRYRQSGITLVSFMIARTSTTGILSLHGPAGLAVIIFHPMSLILLIRNDVYCIRAPKDEEVFPRIKCCTNPSKYPITHCYEPSPHAHKSFLFLLNFKV